MKTLYQIILCILTFCVIFLFYCTGKDSSREIDFDAYHQKDIQEINLNFDKISKEDKPSENLDNYKDFNFKYEYTIKVKGKVDRVTFKLPLPINEKHKQYITNLKINPKPDKIFSVDENTIAEYKMTNLKTGKYTISIEGTAKLQRYDIYKAKTNNKNLQNEVDIKRYLISEKGIESNNAYIKRIADTMQGNTEEEIVANIYNYVRNNIQYMHGTSNPSAVAALKSGRGKCGEFAAAMTALCRAKHIPARIVTGNIARNSETNHTWVEVYFKEYGWVMYDPTVMDTYKTTKVNGVIVKRERIFKQEQYYISSIKNDVSPWYLVYTNTDTGYNGDIKIIENIKIIEVK